MVGRRLGLDHPREVGIVWERWREIVGDDIAAHAEPSSLRAGLLRVRTDSPAWATEIGYLADEIKRKTNETVGRALVTEVRVGTGPGAMPRRPRPRGEGASRASRDGAKDPSTGPSADPPDDPAEALERARRTGLRRRIS